MANLEIEERQPTDEELDQIINSEYEEYGIYGESFTPSEILKTMKPDIYEAIRINSTIETKKYFCPGYGTPYDEYAADCCC